jgi:uncharacterized peroxidase-related enzyme
MTFVETVPEDDAPEAVRAMYDADRTAAGHVPNYTRAFSHRPAVYNAWRALVGAITSDMDKRRYELVTLAAARRLRSSYCALAHGSVLLDGMVDAERLAAIVDDHHAAGLDEVDVAVMDLADKIADDATTVTQADIDRLRGHGLSDAEIFDVVAAASARCFFSKTLDALGAQPDARFASLEPATLREQLTVGRPIGTRA